MKFEVEESGRLRFEIETDEDRESVETILLRTEGDDVSALEQLLDEFGTIGNASFFPISPEDVGALTGSPMVTDCVEYEEDGKPLVSGRVWWFPSYETTNFMQKLLDEGTAVFAAAPENAKIKKPRI